MRIGNILTWERTTGEPLEIGDYIITPESQVLSVRLPFGGFVWNRPAAVLVDDGSDQQRMAVPDVTRAALLTLLVATALFLILGQLLGKNNIPKRF